MISFERAGEILDDAVDKIPDELLEGLNGGINLMPDAVTGDNGMYVMGKYIRNMMGNYIEIYFGSFEQMYGGMSDEKIEEKLIYTLKHELRHHIEGRAGVRDLEDEDEAYVEEWKAQKNGDPIYVDKILFVCEDGGSLSLIAEGIFNSEAEKRGIDVVCESAGLTCTEGALSPFAVNAALRFGADISGYETQPVTEELVKSSSIVFCMTAEQADYMAEEYPRYDMRIYTIEDEDIVIECERQEDYDRAAEIINKAGCEIIEELESDDEKDG